jgi:hypothetical protein
MLELVKASNPQLWQQGTLAAAFAAAALKGNMVAAEHLLQSLEGYQFQEFQLTPALLRAVAPAPRTWPPVAVQTQGCDSQPLARLLLGVHQFSKAVLASCLQRCVNEEIVQLLVAAAQEPWTASDLLPAVASACNERKVDVLRVLISGVEGVRYTEEQLAPLLRDVSRWSPMLVPLLIQATRWTKPVLLSAMTNSQVAECVKLLLGAVAEPWTAEELLPVFNATFSNAWRAGVLVQLLQVEGVQFSTADLRRALEVASRDRWMSEAVDALLKALPRCSQAMLESAINSAPNRRDNAVDKLLAKKKWNREQLWQLVGNAVSSKKHAVLRKVLVAGKGLPWDRNLFKGLYDASTGKGSTVVLVSPFAEALVAAASAVQGTGSSKQKQVKQKPSKQRESSSSDVYAQAAAAAHPPGGGAWAAKHFKAALQLASKGRRANTVKDLLRLPGITWDWRSIKDAWSVAFEKDAKEVIGKLLEVPGVWTGARLKEWSKEAVAQHKTHAKALLKGKLQPEQSQQQQGKGQAQGKQKRKR